MGKKNKDNFNDKDEAYKKEKIIYTTTAIFMIVIIILLLIFAIRSCNKNKEQDESGAIASNILESINKKIDDYNANEIYNVNKICGFEYEKDEASFSITAISSYGLVLATIRNIDNNYSMDDIINNFDDLFNVTNDVTTTNYQTSDIDLKDSTFLAALAKEANKLTFKKYSNDNLISGTFLGNDKNYYCFTSLKENDDNFTLYKITNALKVSYNLAKYIIEN